MKIIKYISIYLLLITFVSCDTPLTDYPEPEFDIVLDGRLPIDNNGYYSLTLISSPHQTIHTLNGILTEDGGYPKYRKKIGWESSHEWVLTDTLGFVIRRVINSDGVWTNVDTTYATGFSGFEVPTINSTSITKDNGTFSGVIAPIFPMRGDTMSIKSYYSEGAVYEWDVIKIILN